VINTTISTGLDNRSERLIELRTEAYRNAGKHQNADLMADEFDEKAIHIGLWLEDEAIASARIINLPENSEWEHDRFIDWQRGWPQRSNTAEISRFIIHPEHRSWEVIKKLCEGIAEGMFLTSKDYFIACCTREMEFFYTKYFGAKMSGINFHHIDLGPKQHQLFICEYKQGLVGNGINYFDWLCLWPTSTRF